jgi:ELWxxDGT repeat protein
MRFASFRQRLKRRFGAAARPSRKPLSRLPLCIELLENRLVPSLIPTLLSHINPYTVGSMPGSITEVNGVAFFTANDGIHGEQLWQSNGSAAGTFMVTDFNPGPVGSGINYLTNVNGTLFFRANDGSDGIQLWESNGTGPGTFMVTNINWNGQYPGPPTNVNGTLFFRGGYGTHGIQLWESNGTAAGTFLVKEINPITNSYPSQLTNVNGTLFFGANDYYHGNELWESNGSAAGTFMVKLGVLSPSYLTNVNGTLFFDANDNGTHGNELWESNGTAAGTFMVADINPGPRSSGPKYLTNVNGTLFFNANDGTHGAELWESNGTAGTSLVADINAGSSGSYPYRLTNVNGTLFFDAKDGIHGGELWESNGTAAGTSLVADIDHGVFRGAYVNYLTNVNGTVFFSALKISSLPNEGTDQLWETNGTAAGTFIVADINPGPGNPNPGGLANVNGTLFFSANDGAHGAELWESNGSAAGTSLVKQINLVDGVGSSPTDFVDDGGTIFFAANDGAHGVELWRSNGSAAGTVLVADMNPGLFGSYPKYLTDVSGTLFFSANDGTHGAQLWQSNGTAAGTAVVTDIMRGNYGLYPTSLTNVNGTLFFRADDGTHGGELWESNGSAAGTFMVADINPGPNGSYPQDLTNVNGTVFFTASDGTHGLGLWESNGTGAALVADINPGSGSYPSSLTNMNGTLFFSAFDGTGYGLWESDGSATGTVLLADIDTGRFYSNPKYGPKYLVNVNGTLFFQAYDDTHGKELWESNGTAAGTSLVDDIFPGPTSSSLKYLTNVNGTLFFSDFGHLWKSNGTAAGTVSLGPFFAENAKYLTNVNGTLFFSSFDTHHHGTELWTSYGTAAGTFMVADLNPGPSGSYPKDLTNGNGTLFFQANDGTHGPDPWVLLNMASPTISTQAGGTIVVGSGNNLTDSATLAGGYNETGTITFTLYGPDGVTVVDTETATVSGDGTYSTPNGYLPTATGTYQWVASYGGDANNNGVSSANGTEPETVSSASPTISTLAGGTIVVGSGSKLTDSATLAGGYNETGTITFTLYAPDGVTVVDTETATVSGDGTYSTPNGYLPTATGTYQWVASYGGDSNNNGVSSTNGSEPEMVNAASPTISTLAGGTIVIGSGNKLTDSATVSGGYNETGTITFTLYGPDGTTVVDTETATVSGDGTYSTPNGYLPTATGTYQWVASYGGDANNNGVSSTNGSEPEMVLAASSTISTLADGTIVIGSGSKLTDSATLAGSYNATGTITFTLYGPDGVTVVDTETATVNGDGTYSTPNGYLPAATGTYQWVASYSGDSNNNGVSSTNGSEPEIVLAASPTISTLASETGNVVGSAVLHDSATLSGGSMVGAGGATITFTLTQPDSTTITVGTVPVTGDGTYNAPDVTATQVGTYTWHASYSGNDLNHGATDDGSHESLTTVKASPTLVTTPNPTAVTLGPASPAAIGSITGLVSDTFGIALGNVSVMVLDGSNHLVASTQTQADGRYLIGGIPVGTYSVQFSLTNYQTVTVPGVQVTAGGTITENAALIVIAAPPPQATVSITVVDGGIGVGIPRATVDLVGANNTAQATGITDGTGSVQFGGLPVGDYSVSVVVNDCAGRTAFENIQVVAGVNPEVVTVVAAPTGTLNGTVTDASSGSPLANVLVTVFDDENNAVASTETQGDGSYVIANLETCVYTVQFSQVNYNVTIANGLQIVAGTSTTQNETLTPLDPPTLTDSAVLSGGYNETGTITFTLYRGSTLVDTETVPVNGDGTYATPTGYTLPTSGTVTGTYQWDAVYSGNGDNNVASDNNDPAEQAVVSPITPTIDTNAAETAGGVVGTAQLSDSATLSGTFFGTGTITFTLTQPDSSTITVGTVAVSGDGIYNAPSVTATEAGSYTWHASYSGDGNNNEATDDASNESLTTIKASPSISTNAGQQGNVVGAAVLSDSVTVSGGDSPGGVVTFTLDQPDGSTVTVGTVTVNGDGTYALAATVTATQVGTYTWHASYAGDGLNNGAVDDGTHESATTVKASPAISTSASEIGNAVGSAVLKDSATLSAGYNETGTITFTLYAPDGVTVVDTETATVNGDGTYSTANGYLPTATGTYQWVSSYGGDSTNNAISSAKGTEPETVSAASPTISTLAGGNIVIGSGAKLTDSATLVGGYNETGTITFTLYGPDGVTVVDTETATVSGDGTYSTANGYLPTATGTYQWVSSYGGDSNNNGISSTKGSEPETVSAASPTISTMAGGTIIVGSGNKMTDSATLSGGYNPTGMITFTLYGPDGVTVVDTETATVSGDGTYSTPNGYLPTASGTYQWVASYGGDSNNNGISSTKGSEPETVSAASPTISTLAGGTVVVGSGNKLTDSATLSGGYNLTGTISFTLYAPNGTTVVDTETATVSGNGTYSTPNGYLPSATGTYQWIASYSGDANNNAASSNKGSEPETVNAASPTISTLAGGTVVVGSGNKLTDSATLAGGYNETGTITFALYGPSNTVVDTETATVSGNGTYSTPNGYLPTADGTYQWVASYGGDSNNNGISSTTGTEPEEVSAASPTISTLAGGTVVVGGGSKLTDSATLSGGYNPTGTITFTLYAPNGTTVVDTETATVSGDGAYSTPNGYLPTATGAYQWVASYGGDSNNNGISSTKGTEPETVSAASPTISTLAGGTVVVGGGSKLTDSATLSGGYNPTGTITFTLYAPNGTTVVDTETATVSGDGTYSTPNGYLPSTTGTYQWVASYGGDSNNNGISSTKGAEPETVSAASPTISTLAGGTIVVGSGNKPTDSATLSGGYNLTGTITFTLYAPNGTTVVDTETATVTGNGTYSTPNGYLPAATGTYQWVASYGGDSNNNGINSTKGTEPETVSAASPTISTLAGGTIVVGSGAKLTDSATLSGGYSSTGTITFTLYAPNGTTVVDTETATVSGNGTYSTPNGYLPTATGTYQWVASYGGDSNNNGISSTKGTEPEAVSAASPTISTLAGGTIVLGSGNKLTDSAMLSGGYNETGTITFTLYAPNGTTVVDTETATVSGNGTYSTPNGYLPTAAGTYQWVASYGGDANNNGISSTKGTEPETVSAASPTISTLAGGTNVVGSGNKLTDSATLSGGYNPTGTITFTLYAPNGATVVDTETATVSGNGTYNTPNGYLPTATGTYQWVASYGGDSNNNGISSTKGAEPETVSAASPTISTLAGGTIVVGSGSKLTDSAMLSGGFNATGTITFTLYAPNGTTVVDTETATVNGNGTYSTPNGYLPTAAGTYQWVAGYGGDSNNQNVSSSKGTEPETVSAASPTISTVAGGSIVVGSGNKLTDSATLSGGYNPTGTITFTLYAPNGTTVVDTETATVNGNGTYSTPNGYLPTAAGTYQWVASYGGNANNNAISSPKGSEPETVTASSGSVGVVVLNPTVSGALSLSGNANIQFPGPIDVDSNSSSALSASGNTSISGTSIQIVGGYHTSGNVTFHPAPVTGAAFVPDPLASLPTPSPTGLTNFGAVNIAGNNTATLNPGIYTQIQASGNASLTLNAGPGGTPGIYIIEGGGLTVTGNASVNGNNIFIYNTGSNYPFSGGTFGGIALSGNGAFHLSAPTTGTYGGILIFQSRANTRALSLSGNAAGGINGTIYAANALLSLSGNAHLNAPLVVGTLNLSGNVALTQMAAGGDGSGDVVGIANSLLAGNVELYVDNSNGALTADELARIQDAINTWDALLAPYNVAITEVSDPSQATITLKADGTSACGGAANGVLGCFDGHGGQITMITGWNWYAGADPQQISANQYDFQTTVEHELGHALGLGGSDDLNSPMNETLAAGVVRRTVAAPDLNIAESPEGADPERAAGFQPDLASSTLVTASPAFTADVPSTVQFWLVVTEEVASRVGNEAFWPAPGREALPALASDGMTHQVASKSSAAAIDALMMQLDPALDTLKDPVADSHSLAPPNTQCLPEAGRGILEPAPGPMNPALDCEWTSTFHLDQVFRLEPLETTAAPALSATTDAVTDRADILVGQMITMRDLVLIAGPMLASQRRGERGEERLPLPLRLKPKDKE